MRTIYSWNKLAVIFLLMGCTPQMVVPAASFPPKSSLLLKTPRCPSGAACSCRPLDLDEGQTEENIPPGYKRFEFRLPRSTSAIWVDIAGRGHFYKPPEQVTPACFYVDLPPGGQRVTVHSELKDQEVGLQTGLAINEYGSKVGHSWYRSLDFICGGLNKCTKAGLEAWRGFQTKLTRGVLDPCGSVMIQNVSFGGSRKHYQDTEYQDLTVRFSMKIYEFEPYQSPGSSECKAPVKNR